MGTEQGTAVAAVCVSRGKGLPCPGCVATGEDGELIPLPLLSFGRISREGWQSLLPQGLL